MAQAKEQPKLKASTEKTDEPPEVIRYCSFCGRPSSETRRLIAGPNDIFICEECVEVCVKILYQVSPTEWNKLLLKIIADPKNKKALPPEKTAENKRKQGKK